MMRSGVLFLLLLAPMSLWGRVVYVDQGGGGDVNTIQKGLNAAADGDTVLVAPGIYNEGDLTFSGKGIYLKSEGGPYAVNIVGQWENVVFDIDNGEGPDCIVEGFRVTAGAGGWFCFTASGSSPVIRNNIIEGSQTVGIVINGGGSPLIKDNILIDHSGDGIEVNLGSSPTIEGNLIYHSGGHAIFVDGGSRPIIRDNIVVSNTWGIEASGAAEVIGNLVALNGKGIKHGRTVSNNVILYNNSLGMRDAADNSSVKKNNIVVGSDDGISLSTVFFVELTNNVIVDCNKGIVVFGSNEPALARNNIIVNNETGVLCFPAQEIDLRYNNVWGNSGGDYVGCAPGEGSVSVDPGFVDPANRHYALASTSQLIDAGDHMILDPDGTRSDIGAYGGPDALPFALTLIPQDTLVNRGDTFLYDVILTNTTSLSQEVQPAFDTDRHFSRESFFSSCCYSPT